MIVTARIRCSGRAGSRSRKHLKAAATAGGRGQAQAASGPASLDLHGKTVDEALEALDTFLNDAILDGRDEVHIVHGRSGGRLKAAVHARLAQLASARAFRIDPANPGRNRRGRSCDQEEVTADGVITKATKITKTTKTL